MIDPFVAPDRWLTEDGVKDIADRINALAEVAAQFGLTVGYHNHAQEFIASFDGQTAYERFIALTEDRVAHRARPVLGARRRTGRPRRWSPAWATG